MGYRKLSLLHPRKQVATALQRVCKGGFIASFCRVWGAMRSRGISQGGKRKRTNTNLWLPAFLCDMIWGGRVANVWGRKTCQSTRPPENILDPSKRASALLSRGFTVRGGSKTPFFGGVSFVRFSSPLFFHPPHGFL